MFFVDSLLNDLFVVGIFVNPTFFPTAVVSC